MICHVNRCRIIVCAVLCALTWGVSASEYYYVTPTGDGDLGGTNWGNAFSNVQAAATLATNAGALFFEQ